MADRDWTPLCPKRSASEREGLDQGAGRLMEADVPGLLFLPCPPGTPLVLPRLPPHRAGVVASLVQGLPSVIDPRLIVLASRGQSPSFLSGPISTSVRAVVKICAVWSCSRDF